MCKEDVLKLPSGGPGRLYPGLKPSVAKHLRDNKFPYRANMTGHGEKPLAADEFDRVLKRSGSGHEQTSRHIRVMSVISLKADIHQRERHVG